MKKIFILLLLLNPFLSFSQIIIDEAENHHGLGHDKLKNLDYQEAIFEFTKSIELSDPKHHFMIITRYHLRAHCKSLLEDFRGAISDYDKIISLAEQWKFKNNKLYAGAFYYRGICKYLIGKVDEACKDWSTAGEYGQTNAYEMIKSSCSHY